MKINNKINIDSLDTEKEFDTEFNIEPIIQINEWANEQIRIGRETR